MLILTGACAYLYFSHRSTWSTLYLNVNIFLNTYHRLIVNFVNRVRVPTASRDLVRQKKKKNEGNPIYHAN